VGSSETGSDKKNKTFKISDLERLVNEELDKVMQID
jgi:hypothetical protein